jgi:hypothetical protein
MQMIQVFLTAPARSNSGTFQDVTLTDEYGERLTSVGVDFYGDEAWADGSEDERWIIPMSNIAAIRAFIREANDEH